MLLNVSVYGIKNSYNLTKLPFIVNTTTSSNAPLGPNTPMKWPRLMDSPAKPTGGPIVQSDMLDNKKD